jgi:hypothetical protein
MNTNTPAPADVVSSTELGEISRDEWQRRYAARIMEKADWPEHAAIEVARVGAELYEEDEWSPDRPVVWWGGPSGEHMSPEDLADEEMSCWTDDGE